MRLQICALPQESTGPNDGDWRNPYLLVLDDVAEDFVEELAEGALEGDFTRSIREESGARGVLVFRERLEVVPTWATAEIGEVDDAAELETAAAAAGESVRASRRARIEPPASI